MKLRKNNRGITLVELIVSAAILGIVAMCASAFMLAGARTYNSVNYAVRLQYQAQLAMAQLQEYTVDCSRGIAWDETTSTLYIVNGDEVHVFDYDSASKEITYGTASFAESLSITVEGLVAEHVESMSVKMEDRQIEITLNMARDNKHYNATQVIALRNRPKLNKDWDWSTLWSALTRVNEE